MTDGGLRNSKSSSFCREVGSMHDAGPCMIMRRVVLSSSAHSPKTLCFGKRGPIAFLCG